MATFAATFRAEIQRLASAEARQVRQALRFVQRQFRSVRAVTRDNARTLARLERQVLRLKLQASRAAQAPPAARASMAPDAIRALRGKQSRKAFARKLGVSPGSIFGWETGRTIPRGRNVDRLTKLKKKAPSAKRTVRRRRRR